MITGQIKNQIDKIWDTFWSSGITTPITILEQMTYLFFIKLLDDEEIKREKVHNMFGDGGDLPNPTFPVGYWENPVTNQTVSGQTLRWHNFKQMESSAMYSKVQNDVFPFIKNLKSGEDSAYSRFMANATFVIGSPRTLQRVVDDISAQIADTQTLLDSRMDYWFN